MILLGVGTDAIRRRTGIGTTYGHLMLVSTRWIMLTVVVASCSGGPPATSTPLPPLESTTTPDPVAEARATVVAGYAELALADDLYITAAEAECAGGIVADALPLEELVARAEQGIEGTPEGTDVTGLTPEAFAACIDPARYLSAIIGDGDPAARQECLRDGLGADRRVDRAFLLALLSGDTPDDLGSVVQEAIVTCP